MEMDSQCTRPRKEEHSYRSEVTNRDAVIRDSGFNVLAHTVGGCLNYLPIYLLSYAQQ